MDNQKPLTADEIAKIKKNSKTMFAIAGVVFVLVMIIILNTGSAPTWMLIIVGMAIAFGFMEMRKAKTAEETNHGGTSAAVPVTHQVVEEPAVTATPDVAPVTPPTPPVTPSEPQA